MPKAHRKTNINKEDMATPHAAINEEEAEHHREMHTESSRRFKRERNGDRS